MFKFELMDGTEAEFPHVTDCGIGVIAKTRKIEDTTERVFSMFEIAFGEDSEVAERFYKVKAGDFQKFMEIFMGGLDAKKA